MLGNKKGGGTVSGATTLISRDTRVVGDIIFSGNLDIEGTVEGNVIADNEEGAFLRIVENGCIKGDIRAPAVVVNGTVEGQVYATQSLELAAKARVNGNVLYTLVEMAVGAEVNGSLKHIDTHEAALAPADVAEEPAPSLSEEPIPSLGNEVVSPMKRA